MLASFMYPNTPLCSWRYVRWLVRLAGLLIIDVSVYVRVSRRQSTLPLVYGFSPPVYQAIRAST